MIPHYPFYRNAFSSFHLLPNSSRAAASTTNHFSSCQTNNINKFLCSQPELEAKNEAAAAVEPLSLSSSLLIIISFVGSVLLAPPSQFVTRDIMPAKDANRIPDSTFLKHLLDFFYFSHHPCLVATSYFFSLTAIMRWKQAGVAKHRRMDTLS